MKTLGVIREALEQEFVGQEYVPYMDPTVTKVGNRIIELLDLNNNDLILNDSALNNGKIYYKNQTLLEFNIHRKKTHYIDGVQHYEIKSIEVENSMFQLNDIDAIIAKIEAELIEREEIYNQTEKRRIELMSKLMEFMPQDFYERIEFFNDLSIIARLNQHYEKQVKEGKLSK